MAVEGLFLKAGIDLIGALTKGFAKLRSGHKAELDRIGKIFGPTEELAKFYIEPRCQSLNPGDVEQTDPEMVPAEPILAKIDKFLGRDVPIRDGSSNLFILSDAGMGKSSLLVMLKLMHLSRFWRRGCDCRLLKLGPTTLADIEQIPNPASTVLLLDSLDEDPSAQRRAGDRLTEVLTATQQFRRAIITCRTQYFPSTKADPIERNGRIVVGNFYCDAYYLSPFSDREVDRYLRKRFRSSLFGLKSHPKTNRARELTRLMKSLRCRPMLLAHIQDFVESDRTFKYEYEMYDVLVERWLAREVRKARERGDHQLTEAALRNGAAVLALAGQQDDIHCFSPDTIEELGRKHDEVHRVEGLSYELAGRSLLVRTDDGFRFSHRSFQEFLVAWCCVNESAAASSFTPRMTDLLSTFILQGLQPRGPTDGANALSLLVALAKDRDEFVRGSAANNAWLPPELLATLVNDQIDHVRRSAASNPNLPAELLAALVDSDDKYVRAGAAANPCLPAELLLFLAEDEEEVVRAGAAQNPKLPTAVLSSLIRDSDPYVRQSAAGNPNLPNALLRALVKSEDIHMRAGVAANPNLSAEQLAVVATDPISGVRLAAATNANLRADWLSLLLSDKDGWVRQNAATNTNLPPVVVAGLLKEEDVYVRAGAAANPHTPPEVLAKFATDRSFELRAAVARKLEPGLHSSLVRWQSGKLTWNRASDGPQTRKSPPQGVTRGGDVQTE